MKRIVLPCILLSCIAANAEAVSPCANNLAHLSSTIGATDPCLRDSPEWYPEHTKKTVKDRKSYLPYIELGASKYFNLGNGGLMNADFFIPIWQHDLSDLVFADIRLSDYTGTPFEGNLHLGYRHLFDDNNQMFGVYGAYDRRKSENANYFNQLTIGAEYWYNKFFVGANIYTPLGGASKSSGAVASGSADPEYRHVDGPLYNIVIPGVGTSEKAMPGIDAEIGYEFIKGLVGYAGAFYFSKSGCPTVWGPTAKLNYDWSFEGNKRILGVFDKVGLEGGVRRDKLRGTVGYIGANLRVGWLFDKKSNLEGVSRHMVDKVRRDPDVVTSKSVGNDEIIWKSLQFKEDMSTEEVVEVIKRVADDPSIKCIDIRRIVKPGDDLCNILKALDNLSKAFERGGRNLEVLIDGYLDLGKAEWGGGSYEDLIDVRLPVRLPFASMDHLEPFEDIGDVVELFRKIKGVNVRLPQSDVGYNKARWSNFYHEIFKIQIVGQMRAVHHKYENIY